MNTHIATTPQHPPPQSPDWVSKTHEAQEIPVDPPLQWETDVGWCVFESVCVCGWEGGKEVRGGLPPPLVH